MASLVKTRILVSLVVLGTLSPRAIAFPQSGTASQPVVVERQFPVASLTEDFEVLRRALDEAHGGFDRFATRGEVHARLDRHRARLDRPMDVATFAGIVAEAIAELRDGHARLELDSVSASALSSANVFPIRVALEGDRLVAQWNDASGDTVVRPGMEIRRINQRSASEVISRLLPKVPGDGFIETGRRVRLAREFAALYWLYVERADHFTIEASGPSARFVTVTLPGVRERERLGARNPVNAQFASKMASMDGPPGSLSVELLPNGIAHLRVRYFDGEDFPARLDSAFRQIRERGCTKLVLDLRGNPGGVDEYGALLVGHFMERPFRYFDRIRLTSIAPSFATWLPRTFISIREGTVKSPDGGFLVSPALHSGVAEQQPSAIPFRGRVVVLVDGGTFSTAADVAAQLRSAGHAVFVGEETGGGYEGNTSGLNASIVLPNSRLRTKIMMYGYWNAVRKPAVRGRGTVPDQVVARRTADVLAGVDPQLARALGLLR